MLSDKECFNVNLPSLYIFSETTVYYVYYTPWVHAVEGNIARSKKFSIGELTVIDII